MTDLHYQHPKLVSIYDLGNGWSDDREFYLSLAGEAPKRVLDLGCGTGLLCNAYAERGHLVTGVEPAPSMLEVARKTPWGRDIEWIEGGAQSVQLDKEFDLIVMTGHAFQVLLRDEDVTASFGVIRKHLDKNGIFAFETRNPEIEWAREWNGMRRELQSSQGIVRESFKVSSVVEDRIVFHTEYAFADEALVSVSELRFMSYEAIARSLNDAGLSIQKLFGDWDSSPFDSMLSREMIFLGGRT